MLSYLFKLYNANVGQISVSLVIIKAIALKPTGEYEVCSVVETWEDQSRIETYSDTGENRKVTITVSMVNERRMRKVLLLKDIDHAPEEVYKNICGGMD